MGHSLYILFVPIAGLFVGAAGPLAFNFPAIRLIWGMLLGAGAVFLVVLAADAGNSPLDVAVVNAFGMAAALGAFFFLPMMIGGALALVIQRSKDRILDEAAG